MTFEDTVSLMLSEDYRDRLRGEYWQTKLRYNRLVDTISKMYKEELDFEPVVSMHEQRDIMFEYLCLLQKRAELENIKL